MEPSAAKTPKVRKSPKYKAMWEKSVEETEHWFAEYHKLARESASSDQLAKADRDALADVKRTLRWTFVAALLEAVMIVVLLGRMP